MKDLELITKSAEETRFLGEKLAKASSKNMVFLLDGDLGAGKTTLTQGIARGLNILKTVTSPTFNILKIYHGDMTLYHFDAYRLEGLHQDLGFDEFLDDEGITVIEWSEFVPSLIPPEHMTISISLLSQDQRRLTFRAYGDAYEKLLEALK